MPLMEDEVLADDSGLSGNGDGDNGSNAPKPPANDPVEERVKLLVTQQMAQVLAIPGVSELLDARQNGKKVRVLGEDDIADLVGRQTAKPEEQEPDYENMPIKEVLGHHQKKLIGAILPELRKMIKESTEPLTQKLGVIEQDTVGRRNKIIQQRIEEGKKKYADWKEMEPYMMEVARTVPTMDNPLELYVLTKLRMNQPVRLAEPRDDEGIDEGNSSQSAYARQPMPDSERPTHSAAQPQQKRPQVRTPQDFSSFLQQQLRQVKLPKELQEQRF